MSSSQHVLLSPAELSYLHASLSLQPLPLRPDGRSPTQFRPLVAETGILPGTNGSARICFADGTEAIVGVKAEVERTVLQPFTRDTQTQQDGGETTPEDHDRKEAEGGGGGSGDWVEMTVEIPGYRDDDPTTVFLGQMLQEALLADGEFTKRLRINGRFHWKIYLDILLISPPLSYPLPLLSLTTHLALLSARLPRLKSEGDEDPLFDDDWAASTYIYPREGNNKKDGKDGSNNKAVARPPVTLLVMAVGNNIIFDPAREELAVADVALAVSVGEETTTTTTQTGGDDDDVDMEEGSTPGKRRLRLLSVRTIDPPSRLTPPGVPNATNTAYTAPTGTAEAKTQDGARTLETERVEGVWKAPRGGAKVMVMAALVAKVLEKGGVADEVLDGLEAVDLG